MRISAAFILLLAVIALAGCSTIDRVAHATTQASGNPVVKETAGAVPYGSNVLNIATLIATGVLSIERIYDRSTRKSA